jgi:thioredoxin 1
MPNLPRAILSLFCLACFHGRIAAADPAPPVPPTLPRLVDLGADKCIPCRLMAPILTSLAQEYAGQLDVVFIDVWKKREAGERYGIRVIPTQIFFDASGRERFRHEGFMPKKDILSKWRELGVTLTPPAPAAKP